MNSTKITEQINQNSINIHKKDIREIVDIFINEDYNIFEAIKKVSLDVEKLIEDVIDSFENNGRLFYIGSGTSGRLGVLDASECPPTFGVDSSMVQGIIAGGNEAVFKSVEGAEDSNESGMEAILKKSVCNKDFVIGISASGTTPYVLGALQKAHQIGSKTALIQCNPNKHQKYINHHIDVIVGPEIISGSTRMKAGTATKIILNMISTISMIKLNKTHGNIMSDLKVANNKLLNRGRKIISQMLSIEDSTAGLYLDKSNGSIKLAVIMCKYEVELEKAKEILSDNNNSLIGIIE